MERTHCSRGTGRDGGQGSRHGRGGTGLHAGSLGPTRSRGLGHRWDQAGGDLQWEADGRCTRRGGGEGKGAGAANAPNKPAKTHTHTHKHTQTHTHPCTHIRGDKGMEDVKAWEGKQGRGVVESDLHWNVVLQGAVKPKHGAR